MIKQRTPLRGSAEQPEIFNVNGNPPVHFTADTIYLEIPGDMEHIFALKMKKNELDFTKRWLVTLISRGQFKRAKAGSLPVWVSEWIKKTMAGEENIEVSPDLLKAEEQKREYVIGGNWKMAVETEDKAVELIRAIAKKLNDAVAAKRVAPENLDIVIVVAPSFVHLPAVRQELKRLEDNGEVFKGLIALGAQDVSAYDPGARTSETSAKQLAGLGIRYVIIGHSERRHGEVKETNWNVNGKVRKALGEGLFPIIAVGETSREREVGRTFGVLREQFLGSTAGLTAEQMKDIVIAYEPVWAIGTGKTATPEEADEAQRFLRALVLDQYGPSAAGAVRIQYGGSMDAANVEILIQKSNIDGGLIGGAALKPDDFVRIVTASLDHFNASSSPLEEQGQGARVKEPGIASDEIRMTNKEVGGIDLNPALLDLQIKRDGNDVPLPLPMQPIENMHIDGFLPVIINITPISNLPMLLGLADTAADTQEVRPALKAREIEPISLLD